MKSTAAARPSTPAMPCWRWRKTWPNSAEQLAAAETNAYRRAELLDSAAILHHVPAHPARSFKEACQAFYLFQLALQLDNGSYAVNPEGADKALLPYYQHDINNGALSPQQAYEIVESLWFKLAELCEVRAACANRRLSDVRRPAPRRKP